MKTAMMIRYSIDIIYLDGGDVYKFEYNNS